MKRNEAIKQAIKAISMVINGGKGSGNFGHSGRPGKVGGSGEGGASDSSTSSPSSKDLMPKRGSYSDLPTIKRTYTDSVTGAQREEVLYRPVFDEKAAKAGSSTPYMYVSENGQKLEGFSKKDYEAILNSDHTKELTDDQKKAITDYTSEYGEGSYKNVNKYARTGQGSDAVVCTMGEYLDNNMDDFLTVQAFLVPKYSDAYLKRKRTELGYNGFLVDKLEREKKIEYRLYQKDGKYRVLKKRLYDYMLDKMDWQKYLISFEEESYFNESIQTYETVLKVNKRALPTWDRESDGDLDKNMRNNIDILLRNKPSKHYPGQGILRVLKITPVNEE